MSGATGFKRTKSTLGNSAAFKPPRVVPTQEVMEEQICSSTEEEATITCEEDEEPVDKFLEKVFLSETKEWLDTNAAALFNLAVARFLADQRKKDKSKK